MTVTNHAGYITSSLLKQKEVSDTRALILAIVQQAVIDYLFPDNVNFRYTKNDGSASRFLFDDDYMVEWGDVSVSPRELLMYADLDIDYLRRKVRAKELDQTRPTKRARGVQLV